jgi:hypothetical protein
MKDQPLPLPLPLPPVRLAANKTALPTLLMLLQLKLSNINLRNPIF